MFRVSIAVLLLASAVPGASSANTISAPSELTAVQDAEIDGLSNDFFGRLKGGRFVEAYKTAFDSPLMKKREADLETVAASTEATFKTYGEIVDWEAVAEEIVSHSFVRRLYIVRTPNAPIFFVIEYYFVANRWTVHKVNFSDTYSTFK